MLSRGGRAFSLRMRLCLSVLPAFSPVLLADVPFPAGKPVPAVFSLGSAVAAGRTGSGPGPAVDLWDPKYALFPCALAERSRFLSTGRFPEPFRPLPTEKTKNFKKVHKHSQELPFPAATITTDIISLFPGGFAAAK